MALWGIARMPMYGGPPDGGYWFFYAESPCFPEGAYIGIWRCTSREIRRECDRLNASQDVARERCAYERSEAIRAEAARRARIRSWGAARLRERFGRLPSTYGED
jgi:hypothetical protein